MKVILRENVENLGQKGDIVNVAKGYGRNFLLPRKFAIEVTKSNIKMIQMEQQALKRRLEKEMLSHKTLIERLNATTLTFTRKSGEKDLIFGSVSTSDIKEVLDQMGFDIEKKKIILEEPLKRLGNYSVPVKIFHEHRANVKVEILQEEETDAKEEKGELQKEPVVIQEAEPGKAEEGRKAAEAKRKSKKTETAAKAPESGIQAAEVEGKENKEG